MRNALVNVLLTMVAEALLDCFVLVELAAVCQALKLELFEALLDLAEGQLNRIEFRTVRHVVDPLHP